MCIVFSTDTNASKAKKQLQTHELGINATAPFTVSILAVIVLYKIEPSDSASFMTMQSAARHVSSDKVRLKILLYDNTPGGCDPGILPEYAIYKAARRNEGISGAYNSALEMATTEGFTWLLTLDQDTTLPLNYLSRMSELALDIESNNRVAAIVPRLSDAGRTLSPVRIRFWGVSYLPSTFIGIPQRETHAFNSASLFRVSALRQIGGFNPYFWLDFLDAWVYKQLYRHGRQVYVAGDIQIEHELSLLDSRNRLTSDRFSNIIKAECAYFDLYEGRIRGAALTARLFGRLYRQNKRGEDAAIRQLTKECLQRRLFQSRKLRIDDWRKEIEIHPSCLPYTKEGNCISSERPAISVCMAAYNGERYITAQLQSILSQLTDGDEVIVVDDASTDSTQDCIRAIQDIRIRLIEHKENRGILHTFEDAIRNASNSILFLSDQDDLWSPKKVSTILQAFERNSDVMLVATDSAIVDESGTVLSESYFAGMGEFNPGLWANLIHNRYGGCTLAFRAKIISEILPFPHKYEVLHDIWIGVRNSLSHGGTLYINQPLVLCRRHSANATGQKKLSTMQKIRVRLHLLLALAEFSIRELIAPVMR